MTKSRDCTPSRWGKAREGRLHRLTWHGLDVGAVLAVGFERRPDLSAPLAGMLAMEEGDARAMLLSLTALHDIGKVMHAFQALDPAAAKKLGLEINGLSRYDRQNYGHDRAGLAIFRDLKDVSSFPSAFINSDRRAVLPLVSAITGHHGGPRGGHDDLAYYAGRW